MAYTTPASLSAGQTLTATHLNLLRAVHEATAKPPIISAYKTADQPISTGGSYTTVSWQATDTGRDIALAANIFTPAEEGLFLVNVNVAWAANATGTRKAVIIKNGVWVLEDTQVPVNGSWQRHSFARAALWLDTNDQLTIGVNQDSGGALNILSGVANGTAVQIVMQSRL